MKIRHSEEKDIARIMEIYEYARDFMKKTAASSGPFIFIREKKQSLDMRRSKMERGSAVMSMA